MFLKHTLQSLITGQHDRVALGREEVERCDNRPRFRQQAQVSLGHCRCPGQKPRQAARGGFPGLPTKGVTPAEQELSPPKEFEGVVLGWKTHGFPPLF